MIPYVGDVSRRDAELLKAFAERSKAILEFGCGASTQILRAYGAGAVDSVDTSMYWIARTQRNLERLELKRPVSFHQYETFRPVGPYDLIFVDGLNELRLPFACVTWPTLAIGGLLCLHDTRRTEPYGRSPTSDVQHVAFLLERYSREIESVILNQYDSNITVIKKRAPLLLDDWMKAEGRTPAQMGIEP